MPPARRFLCSRISPWVRQQGIELMFNKSGRQQQVELRWEGVHGSEQNIGSLDIDWFASRLINQLDSFLSWRPDPDAWEQMPFSSIGLGGNNYPFHPFAMISRCLAQIRKQLELVVVVAPLRKSQPWYPILLKLSKDCPIHLLVFPQVLRSPCCLSPSHLAQGTLVLGWHGVFQALHRHDRTFRLSFWVYLSFLVLWHSQS